MKRSFLRLVVLCAFLAAVLPVRAADESPVTYIEYRYVADWITADSFDAAVRKLWRQGRTRLRLEEPTNPLTGARGLLIANAPDSWLVDQVSNKAKHFADPGPTYNVKFPALPFGVPDEARRLEMGDEEAFFAAAGAADGGEAELDGVACRMRVLKIGDTELRLWVEKGTRRPRQLAVRNDKVRYSVRYDVYRMEVPYDAKWFAPPEGTEISEGR